MDSDLPDAGSVELDDVLFETAGGGSVGVTDFIGNVFFLDTLGRTEESEVGTGGGDGELATGGEGGVFLSCSTAVEPITLVRLPPPALRDGAARPGAGVPAETTRPGAGVPAEVTRPGAGVPAEVTRLGGGVTLRLFLRAAEGRGGALLFLGAGRFLVEGCCLLGSLLSDVTSSRNSSSDRSMVCISGRTSSRSLSCGPVFILAAGADSCFDWAMVTSSLQSRSSSGDGLVGTWFDAFFAEPVLSPVPFLLLPPRLFGNACLLATEGG